MFNVKQEIMQTLYEIIQNSAIGSLSKWYKSAVLLLFSFIVFILASMLVHIINNIHNLTITFGY